MSVARVGIKRTEEIKRKISATMKRLKIKPPSSLGRHLSEESKRKIGASNKGKTLGRKLSEETKKKIGERSRGRVLSLEARAKISVAKKGKQLSRKHIKSLSRALMGRKLSEKTRRKMSESRKGDKSSFWRGGVTPVNKLARTRSQYKLWRTAIFERDNYTCVWCGTRGGELNADHIKPFALYPELRFLLDNGRTLCVPCHRKTDTYASKTKSSQLVSWIQT